MLLDSHRVLGELGDLGVGQAQHRPVGLLDVDELGRPPDRGIAGVDHLDRLFADSSLEDGRPIGGESGLVDVELVGIDRTLNDGLTQPVRGGDEDRVGEAGLGVHREHHPGGADVGAHHLLNACGQGDRVVVEVVVDAVGDGPVVVERREHLLDGLHDGVGATDVEEGLLLAGERRIGQVFRRRTGSDRERQLLVTTGELRVAGTDLSLEIRWEWLGDHRRANAATHHRQARDVVGVEVSELRGDGFGQTLVGDESAIGVCRGGEPVRHPHTCLRQVLHHFAQG